MSCDRSRQPQWSAWLDGELPDAQAQAWHAHVAQCDDCRRALQWHQGLRTTLHAAPRAQADDAAESRWQRQARLRVEDRRVRQLSQRLTAAAALLLVACLTSLSLSTGQAATTSALTLAEVDTLLLHSTPALRTEEPVPQSMLVAQWLAADLGSARGERP
jgi:anti-sigma factor RsiW